jgi:hypothetical protein
LFKNQKLTFPDKKRVGPFCDNIHFPNGGQYGKTSISIHIRGERLIVEWWLSGQTATQQFQFRLRLPSQSPEQGQEICMTVYSIIKQISGREAFLPE